jgi:hypothetical protein
MDHRRLAMRGRRNAVMSAPLRVGTARPVARKLSDSDSIIVPPAVALHEPHWDADDVLVNSPAVSPLIGQFGTMA